MGKRSISVALLLASIGILDAHIGFTDESEDAREILRETGIKGGLIVHLGCGEGKLTAALRANDAYLVHGLDTDAGNVAKARKHARSLGVYGNVSIDQLTGPGLPYADDLVNLLVSEDLGSVPMAECLRVLAPEGVAYAKRSGACDRGSERRPLAWPREGAERDDSSRARCR